MSKSKVELEQELEEIKTLLEHEEFLTKEEIDQAKNRKQEIEDELGLAPSGYFPSNVKLVGEGRDLVLVDADLDNYENGVICSFDVDTDLSDTMIEEFARRLARLINKGGLK